MKSSKLPLIGITTVQTFHEKPVVLANQTYVDLVASAGGIPVLITQNPDVIERLDGLLIIGGQDVDPAFWQAKPEVTYADVEGVGKRYLRPLDYAPNIHRDQFELAVYKRAKERKIPVFGICRGLQLINVAEGGSLYQELPESQIRHETGSDKWTHSHFIKIDPNSQAYEFIQVQQYVMSSRHHQGIDRLGHHLKATAWAEDGLIEMIEWNSDDQWIMAVQGHMEQDRLNFPLYDRLMAAFIERAKQQMIEC